MFSSWQYLTNLKDHYNWSIWLIWIPDYYRVLLICKSSWQITCDMVFIPLQLTFEITYSYFFNIKDKRKYYEVNWWYRVGGVINHGWC